MADINKIAVDKQLGVNESGDGWVYPSGSASGHIQVEVPALPGSITPTETLLIKDFGGHVSNKIEGAFNRGYMKSGPQQSATQVFAHYTAVARGAQLVDEQALTRMEILAHELAQEPEKQEYFTQVVKPWLVTLTPRRR